MEYIDFSDEAGYDAWWVCTADREHRIDAYEKKRGHDSYKGSVARFREILAAQLHAAKVLR